jgi:hypothetical protein
MYAGHIGIAIGATARRPDIPLAVLVVASLLPDLLVDPLFHTVPAVVALVVAAYLVGWLRWDGEVAMVLSALVLSHLLVDLLTATSMSGRAATSRSDSGCMTSRCWTSPSRDR